MSPDPRDRGDFASRSVADIGAPVQSLLGAGAARARASGLVRGVFLWASFCRAAALMWVVLLVSDVNVGEVFVVAVVVVVVFCLVGFFVNFSGRRRLCAFFVLFFVVQSVAFLWVDLLCVFSSPVTGVFVDEC